MSELDAIRARRAAVPAPPWHPVEGEDGIVFIVADATHEEVVSTMYSWETAEFIAAAPADIDALLAEVERLRIENAALNVALDLADAAARDLGY